MQLLGPPCASVKYPKSARLLLLLLLQLLIAMALLLLQAISMILQLMIAIAKFPSVSLCPPAPSDPLRPPIHLSS